MCFQTVHITKILTVDLEGRLKYSDKPDSIDHKTLDSQTSCSITGEALLSRGRFFTIEFCTTCIFPVHLSDSTSQNKLFLHLPIINSRPQLWPIDKIIKACKVFLSANWILFQFDEFMILDVSISMHFHNLTCIFLLIVPKSINL